MVFCFSGDHQESKVHETKTFAFSMGPTLHESNKQQICGSYGGSFEGIAP